MTRDIKKQNQIQNIYQITMNNRESEGLNRGKTALLPEALQSN